MNIFSFIGRLLRQRIGTIGSFSKIQTFLSVAFVNNTAVVGKNMFKILRH